MGTVKLHAVVKEDIDTEIEDFREFFKGEIHLDEKVSTFLILSVDRITTTTYFFFLATYTNEYCVQSLLHQTDQPNKPSSPLERILRTTRESGRNV